MEFDGSKVKLTMSDVQTSDSDSYKCVAENEAGQDQIKANVSVIGRNNVFHITCLQIDFSSTYKVAISE